MRTLDQILMDATMSVFKPRIDSLTDLSGWTPKNRDTKMLEAAQLAVETSTSGEDIISNMLNKDSNGDSLIGLTMQREFLGGVYQFLENWRVNLDAMDDNDLKTQPVDYDWLNNNIRSLYKQVLDLDQKIEKMARSESVDGLVTEL